MKKFVIFILILVLLASSGLNAQNGKKKITLVKENHSELSFKGVSYILDRYIIMFDNNPYYISVQREDKASIKHQEAIDISIYYTKQKGCTSKLKRLPNLDKYYKDKTKWMIGISC